MSLHDPCILACQRCCLSVRHRYFDLTQQVHHLLRLAEIDQDPEDYAAAHRRALTLRHAVEQLGTDSLRRFARAYGPQPLSMNAAVARRYAEVDLFLRQTHGERDLQVLGEALSSGNGNLFP